MSWSGIASNQTVSCNNLQDGVNTGVFIPLSTIPVSQKQITKTEASSYVAINTSYPSFSSKSATQLVVKSDLDPLLYSNRIYGVDDTNPYNPPGAPTFGVVIYSGDLGSTWSATSVAGYSVSRSGTGQYVLAGLQTDDIKVSSNYGVTFTSRSCTMSLAPVGLYYMSGTCVSSDGQYMYVIGWTSSGFAICKSSDYGVTWTNIYYFPVTGLGQQVQFPVSKIACSGNGQYVTAIGNLQTGSFAWGSRIFKSSNYGTSFSVNNFADRYWTDVAINTSGQYQLLSQQSSFGTGNVNGEGRIYLSSNYGASFIEKTYDQYDRALYCDMFESGQYMLVALVNTNNTLNKFYYSTNYGASFSSFNTNPPIPAIGQTPGGVFVSSDGTYALITYIDSAQITYTSNWSTWTTVSIPTAYTFGGLNKSRFLSIPGPTTTTTSTTANPNYDYYLADEYICGSCNLQNTNVLVGFPTGTSVIINRFYADIGGTGFVYQITQSTSPGSPAILLTLPSATTCNGACIL